MKKLAINETRNPIHRARYADFLWEALRKQKDTEAHQYARIAVEAYLQCVELYVEQRAYLEMADALPRTVELSIAIHDKLLGQKVTEVIFSTLPDLPVEARARWVLDLGRALIVLRQSRLGQLVTDQDLRRVLQFADEGARFFSKEQKFYLQRNCLLLAADIAGMISEPDTVLARQMQVAESFEVEAETKLGVEGPTGGSLVAAHFLEQAINQYLRLLSMGPDADVRQQIRAKIETLKGGIRRFLKQAEEDMKTIRVEFEFPLDELKPLVEPLLNLESSQAFQGIAVAEWLLPDVESTRKHAEEVVQKLGFARLALTSTIREGTKVQEYGLEAKVEEQMAMEMGMFIQTQMLTLDYIFARFKEAGLWTAETLVNYLRHWELMDESDLDLIVIGIQDYFAGDYISAIHILALRIEHVLKGMFEKAGVPLLTDPHPRGQLLEQGLGDFLRRESVRRTLGERVWWYLEYVLVNPAGLNLRNDVAHGWISKARCNQYTAQLLVYSLILLTRFGIAPE